MPQLDQFPLLFQIKTIFLSFFFIYFCFLFLIVPFLHLVFRLRKVKYNFLLVLSRLSDVERLYLLFHYYFTIRILINFYLVNLIEFLVSNLIKRFNFTLKLIVLIK